MAKYNCWYQSIENPNHQYDIREIIYRCPKTGSLLEVEHDLEALKTRTPDYWKELFATRYRKQQWPARVGYAKVGDGPWLELWNDGSKRPVCLWFRIVRLLPRVFQKKYKL